MIKGISLLVCVLVLSVILLPACNKTKEEEGSAWQQKFTGDYFFTTIYHNDTYQTDDTTTYNGKITVQDEINHLVKISFTQDKSLSPHISDDGILYLENMGSHSNFTGQFDENGNVEFLFRSYWESWHVTGVKL